MSNPMFVLAAAWLVSAGEPAPLPVGPAQQGAPSVIVAPTVYPAAQPVYSYPVQESKPGFFARIKGKFNALFNKKQQTPNVPCSNCQQQGVPAPVPVYQTEPPLADVQQSTYAPVPLNRPAQEPGAEEQSVEAREPGQELNRKYVEKIGHEEDYSWVTGQLYSVRTGNGNYWVVRYATIDTEDKFGGAIVLAPAVSMKNFREGDLVSVKGEIIEEGRANKHLASPLYRATSIDMIERAD